MDAITLLMKRQSLRVYGEQTVPQAVKRQVLEATVRAPSAGALMLYSIMEIEEQALKDRLSETCDNQPFIAKAPWVLLFLADYQRIVDGWAQQGLAPNRKIGVGDMMLAIDDALIAAQNAVVAAEALGLGSCYIGDVMENAENHRALLSLPRYVFPAAMLCIGYPKPGHSRDMVARLPVDEVLFVNRYEKRSLSERCLGLSVRALQKYEMPFSVEMNRSVEDWMREWTQ